MLPSADDVVQPGAIAAEFESARALRAATAALLQAGWSAVEWYTPFDLDAADATRPPRASSPLPLVGLAGGIIGAVGAYLIEWWTNVRSYPLNVGGRPRPAIPAFIPIAFESMILAAALSVVVAWLIMLRLPRLWAPIDEVPGFERASIDRFWLQCAPPADMPAGAAVASLRMLGATRVAAMPESA